MAGKHQGNVMASLMENFQTARNALNTSLTSSGSAMKEHARASESVEFKINALKAAWQGFAKTFMNSDLLKGGVDVIKTIIDLLEKLVDNFGLLGTIGLGAGITGVVQYFKFLKNDGAETVKTITDVVNAIDNLTSTVSNAGSAAKTMGDIAESTGDAVEGIGDTINVVGDGMDAIGDAVKATGDIAGAVGNGAEAIGDITKAADDGIEAMTDLGGAVGKTNGGFKAFMKTPMGVASAIGVVVAAIALAINAYKNYREEQSRLRQETIETADTFLDSAGSFEQAYIKYSGRTDLTSEEEAELESAIKGTVDALDDKSSALHNVVNSSSDYLASLEAIKNAELEAAEATAKKKRDNAELELKDIAMGLSTIDGSEVDIEIVDPDAISIAKKMESKFYDNATAHNDAGVVLNTPGLVLPGDADTNEIIDYYYTLLEFQERLSNEKERRSNEGLSIASISEHYERVSIAIDKMAESIATYENGVYDAAKAQYQLANGIPKTTEAYLEMRKSILKSENLKNLSLETKQTLANTLDSEYGQVFDLTTAEAQAKKLIGVLDKYDDTTAGEVETFLNMRTAVNNNDCTVGQYLSEFDKINAMTVGWSDEEKEIFNTSFGLDTDSIKKQYDDVYKYISRNYLKKLDTTGMSGFDAVLYKGIELQKIQDILDGLSATELRAVANIKTEIDWETANTDKILAQIKKEAEFIEAMNFTIAIDVETESVAALNSALAESMSATGLSSESIAALKGRYEELASKGYDLSAMFEETANGIHLNRSAVNELERAYAKQKLSEADSNLDVLKGRYDELTDKINKCTDASERASLYREQQSVVQKINDLGTLAAQYDGLASSYNAWLSAEESGSERDMYEKIIEGFETVGDEISRGWLDDGTTKFLELLTGRTDLATLSAKELKDVYKGLDKEIKNTGYSVRDFFTVDEEGNSTSKGVYNFLEAVESLEVDETFKKVKDIKNLIQRDEETGKITAFNFDVIGGDEAVAKALGISEELVQIMQRAADDAGFVVTLDGNWTQFADLQNQAEEANNALKKIAQTNSKLKNAGFGDYEFNFGASDIKTISEELEKAKELLNNDAFKDKEGNFNINAKGAKEALKIAETLQITKSKLEEPAYMSVDASQLQKELQEPVKLLQDFEGLTQERDLLNLTGEDKKRLSEIDTELNSIADKLYKLPRETKIALGIDGLTVKGIREELENGTIEVPAELTIEANMDKSLEDLVTLGLLEQGLINEKEAKIRLGIEVEADKVDTSDVEEKVDNAVNGRSGKFGVSREANIEIIAEVTGTEDVDGLTSKLKGLDDKTIQAIAEVIGQVGVDDLKLALSGMSDVQVQAIAEAIGKGDVEGLQSVISGLDSTTVQAIAQAFGYDKVSQLNTAIQNLDPKVVQAIAQALGLGDVNTLQSTVNNMQGNTVDAKVNTDGQAGKVNALQTTINGMQGNTVKAAVNTDGQAGKVDSLQSKINSLKGKIVKVGVDIASGGAKKAAQRTGADLDGKGTVNGTANVNGTTGKAFKQGSWGTKDSGTALVGELGREVLIRGGRYYTVGDYGAEFIRYQRGDIILNHVQSEQLFKNGKVTADGGRAKALVNGTAFAQGAAFSKGTGGGIEPEVTSVVVGTNKNTGKSYTKSTDSDSSKDFEELFDLIEIAIARIEREIDNLDQKANNVYKSWSSRNTALANQISKVGDEIALQQKAYDEYMRAASGVGLSSDWVKKIQNGEIDIETIKDEVLAEKIKDYQKW